jgi:hypothetical protein
LVVLGAGCRSNREDAEILPRDTLPLSFNRGTVVGHVLDDRTSSPVPHMTVLLDDYPLSGTDSAGWYQVSLDRYMEPGWHQVNVGAPGYIEERRTVWMDHGTFDTVDLRLRRAPLPKARLEGAWTVLLRFERRGALGPPPSKRAVSGIISFADTLPPVWSNRAPADSFVTNEVGRYDIDLTPFFGSQIAQDVSSTTFGSTGGSFAIEATGSVFSYDSVTIDLIPRISHGGLSFSGRMVGDSVVGEWVQRAYCCGATGTFMMRRAR